MRPSNDIALSNFESFSFQVAAGSRTHHYVDLDTTSVSVSTIPLPAAAWLFGSALAGLIGLRVKQR